MSLASANSKPRRLAPPYFECGLSLVDIGIAGEHLVLAATELGLGTCWIGWIRPRVLAKIVGWPTSVKPVVVITVGYASATEPVQLPVSRRRPLAELVRCL
jgi:nitroreductase